MKRYSLFLAIATISILGFFLITTSCKKEDSDENNTTPSDVSPSLIFKTGSGFVSSDTTLPAGQEFNVGVFGSMNPNTNINLATFKVTRTLSGATQTVYEKDDIGESFLSWESTEITIPMVAEEEWKFTIMDYTGETKQISFVILTASYEPYTPVITASYQVVNNSGTDLLQFQLTCETDDWEPVKLIATYPGGFGSEEYIGNGSIIPKDSPYTFPNYFTKLGGTWTFSVLGYIKSGQHNGESFSVVTAVTVTS